MVGLCAHPPYLRFIGRIFNEPACAKLRKRYLLPISERPDTHTCAIDIGPRHAPLAPEDIVRSILRHVRKRASDKLGEKIVDASIAVPTPFTMLQGWPGSASPRSFRARSCPPSR
jgi:molecular chaperone DnaK (HSP70)